MKIINSIKSAIKKSRIEKKMTIYKAAKLCGISEANYKSVEDFKIDTRSQRLFEVAEKMDVSISIQKQKPQL